MRLILPLALVALASTAVAADLAGGPPTAPAVQPVQLASTPGAIRMSPAPAAAELSASAATAQAAPGGVTDAPLTAPLDQAVGLTLPRKISKVAIGATDVVAANVINDRTLVISGRKFGLTNILVYDDAGNVMLNRQIAVPATQPNSVSVYNGASRTSYICTPLCATPEALAQAGGTANAAGGAGATSSPLPAPTP